MVLSDPFIDDLASASSDAAAYKDYAKTQSFVRRPYMGMVHSDDYFAYISVKSAINGTGDPTAPQYISIIDSSTPNGTSTHAHNFMLTQVDFGLQEKAQIVETFGSDYAFFFGQRPVVMNCAGFLLNSRDFNWWSEWLFNYQNYLRGTACVKSKSRVYLGFKKHIAVGYLLSTNVTISAQQENSMGFSFTMLLTNFVDYSRHQPRTIDANKDIGYTVNSKTGTRAVEYDTGTEGDPKGDGPEISYVDFYEMQVVKGTEANVMPSVDLLNSTWWLPDSSPLNSIDAMRELSILQYMEENGVTREEALLAGLQNKLLSSDPENYDEVKSVFGRSIQNGIIIT